MKLWETGPESSPSAIEAFLAGQDVVLDARLLPYEIYGSMAHAVGLHEIDILTKPEIDKIQGALAGLLDAGIEIRPEDEDIHTVIERHLTQHLGETGEKIHTGRSRNDQVLVNLRLYAKDHLMQIAVQSLELTIGLLDVARQHEFVPMPGTTHTRFAMPSSIGLWASSFADGILEDIFELEAAYQLVNRCPLGSSAGYGVPLQLKRERVAELLGFDSVQINTLNATSGRGKLDFVVISALVPLMLDLGRLASDLIWGSSERFQFFEIPREYCTGSSIMPNKHNPDVLELIRAKAGSIAGNLVQVAMISQGQISGYHRDHQELKGALMSSISSAMGCLTMMLGIVSSLKINSANLEAAHTPELYAVDQMIEEVKRGQPLRSAYRAVKENLAHLEMPDFEDALRVRSHLGGPGNLALDQLSTTSTEQLAHWKSRQQNFQERLDGLLKNAGWGAG